MKLAQLKKLWNEFFYSEVPVDGLCYFRFFLGLIMLATFMQDMVFAEFWWGDSGIQPLNYASAQLNFFHLNLFEVLPNSPLSLTLLLILQVILLIFFTLGFKTKITSIILLVTTLTFHQRNMLILNSADLLLRLFLFYMVFAPCANKFSLDSYFAKKKGLRLKENVSAWTLRLIQLQISFVYISTFVAKSKGALWLDGSAVYYATRLEDLTRFYFPIILDTYFTIKVLTWSTLLIEFSLGFLVWIKEFTKPIIILGILFHLGIEWTMSIPTFELLMIVSLVMMLNPNDLKNYIAIALKKIRNEKTLG